MGTFGTVVFRVEDRDMVRLRRAMQIWRDLPYREGIWYLIEPVHGKKDTFTFRTLRGGRMVYEDVDHPREFTYIDENRLVAFATALFNEVRKVVNGLEEEPVHDNSRHPPVNRRRPFYYDADMSWLTPWNPTD